MSRLVLASALFVASAIVFAFAGQSQEAWISLKGGHKARILTAVEGVDAGKRRQQAEDLAEARHAPVERRFLFVAGGTGIAPLRAMMRHAIGLRRHRIGLLYSARTPAEFAYEGELRRLAEEGHIELKQTVTRDVGPDWNGQRGRIGPADLAPLVHAAATMCFVCGPPALVDEVPRLLEGLGVPRSRIRIEEWG